MEKLKEFFKGTDGILKAIFVPNNEELLHFYWGIIIFYLFNTFISALAATIAVAILAFGLSAWRYYNLQKPFLLRTILFTLIPVIVWFIALLINKWI